MNISYKLTVPTAEQFKLTSALQKYVSLKGKDPASIVNKAAGYVALFAAARGANQKIPVAEAEVITVNMLRKLTTSRRTHETRISVSKKTGKVRRSRRIRRPSKVVDMFLGTFAAAMVAKILKNGSPRGHSKYYERMIQATVAGSPSKSMSASSGFYKAVKQYAGMRRGAAGYLRSGMFPAIKAFAPKGGSSSAKPLNDPLRKAPGDASVAINGRSITRADMTNYAKGISKVAPDALKKAERQVIKMYEGWVREALDKAAVAQGFKKA